MRNASPPQTKLIPMAKLIVLIAVLTGMLLRANSEFDAASIKPSRRGGPRQSMKIDSGPNHIHQRHSTRRLMSAYSAKDYQISGPDWIRADRFRTSLPHRPPGAVR